MFPLLNNGYFVTTVDKPGPRIRPIARNSVMLIKQTPKAKLTIFPYTLCLNDPHHPIGVNLHKEYRGKTSLSAGSRA
jgi:hypothetical protein